MSAFARKALEIWQAVERKVDLARGTAEFIAANIFDKIRRQVFRAVPVPSNLIGELCTVAKGRPRDTPIWQWSRQTAWRRVKSVMGMAGIAGAQAMPKGLRHGFGVANAEENVPMATTQKWLGHAYLETTAIYQQAVGREEHAFAKRLWRHWR